MLSKHVSFGPLKRQTAAYFNNSLIPSATNCTAIAAKRSPITRSRIATPPCPSTRCTSDAARRMKYVATKVIVTAKSTGKAKKNVLPCATSTIVVAIAPGPASSGMASGTSATSSLCAPSSVSSGEVRVPGRLARSISSAVNMSSSPPATRKELKLIPKNLKITLPKSANKIKIPNAVKQARRAVRLSFSGESPAVIAKNIGTTPMGSTTKNTADKAIAKNVNSSLTDAAGIDPAQAKRQPHRHPG